MSRATGGARPWNESAGRVGQRHLPRPPTSALIDAPRQSNFRLRASFFVAIITTATTPDSHPDCRALLIQIVALHGVTVVDLSDGGGREYNEQTLRSPDGLMHLMAMLLSFARGNQESEQ